MERVLHHVVWNRKEILGGKMDPARVLREGADLLAPIDRLRAGAVMDRVAAGRELSDRIREGKVGIDSLGVDVVLFNHSPSSQFAAVADVLVGSYNIEGDAVAILLANDLGLEYPTIIDIMKKAGYDASLTYKYGTQWMSVPRYPRRFSTLAGYDVALIGDAEAI